MVRDIAHWIWTASPLQWAIVVGCLIGASLDLYTLSEIAEAYDRWTDRRYWRKTHGVDSHGEWLAAEEQRKRIDERKQTQNVGDGEWGIFGPPRMPPSARSTPER